MAGKIRHEWADTKGRGFDRTGEFVALEPFPRIQHGERMRVPGATQAILHGAGDLRLETVELGSPGPDQVYVETEVTALSTGTDLGNYLGKSTEVPGAPGYPRPVGYSNAGVIRLAGAGVDPACVGRRVFSLKPHVSAYLAGAGDMLVPVPDGVTPENASLSYLTQLGLSALRKAAYRPGESVAVIGLGVIGLCTVALARDMGADVRAGGNSDPRAAMAKRLGARQVWVNPASGPRPDADIVVLTANTWEAYRQSMEIVRPGGRVAILGFPGRGQDPPDFNPLDPAWLYKKQISILGAGHTPRVECAPDEIRFNLRRNLEYILSRMACGSLMLEQIITHKVPAARMREIYELAKEHDKRLLAAVFDWRSA